MKRDAVISACGAYRYWLTRTWDDTLPVLAFVMFNPSTADAAVDDATIRKCIGFAERNDYGGIIVVNLFAYRATKPADLKRNGWRVGPLNDIYVRKAVQEASQVVLAWGTNAKAIPARRRVEEVLVKLDEWQCAPLALKVTRDGVPCHPLMLAYSCPLRSYPPATNDEGDEQ